ncbi:MAG TPA: spore photoproduct lyase, partial [Paenibacillaceae bacterium]|nr:spore photoproduct lyase [Paenibacillaceae bacterium]
WGRYGKFKYVYPQETETEMKEFFQREIMEAFPQGEILYFV